MADASYPDDLLYHPEHDWVRLDGDTATFGITWFAQDALGEVVFFEPPEVGSTVSKDEPYAEVESVKAVSDVIAPMSGEIVEVNTALSDKPEAINEDPYGDGWLARVKLSDPSREGRPARRGRLLQEPVLSEHLHVDNPRGPRAMLAEIGVASLEELFDRQIPAAVRLRRALDLPAGHGRAGRLRAPARRWPRPTRAPRTRSPSSAPGCTTTTSRRSSTCSWGARSS